MSLMQLEAAEASDAVARQLAQDGERYAALGAQLRATPPRSILTLARGSTATGCCRWLFHNRARARAWCCRRSNLQRVARRRWPS